MGRLCATDSRARWFVIFDRAMDQERDWFYPAITMTALLCVVASMGDRSSLPLLAIFPMWLFVGLLSLGAVVMAWVLRLISQGELSPSRQLRERLNESSWPLIGFILAGLNLCAFMRVKPLLNRFIPFTADPFLARVDRAIFFGHDGAKLLSWFNTDALAIFYSRAWFTFLVVALLVTLFRPPSREKTRLILVYFALWTFAGPLIHLLMPAAGPLFYKAIGYGNHFEYLDKPGQLLNLRDYLWRSYVSGEAGPGAGISAMPSMHVATTAWAAFAIRQLWPKTTIAVVAVTIFILSLSVALGWHYLVDGLVGVLSMVVLFRLEPSGWDLAERLRSRWRSGVGPLSSSGVKPF